MADLIKCYGEFWNPNAIDWGKVGGGGNKGQLVGKIKGSNKNFDCWEARGIYVLYDNFKPVYVGKAFGDPIGKRIRDHFSDRFAGRWEMFSWYSVCNIRTTTGDVSKPGSRQVEPESVVSMMEALAILIADPPLNRKREALPNAKLVEQAAPKNKTIRAYLEDIIKQL